MNILERRLPFGSSINKPDRIIVHAMSEIIKYKDREVYAHDFLAEIGLSAHALIWPNGDVMRCRNDLEGAYHAKNHNKNTLGVEFLVEGSHDYLEFKKAIETPYLSERQLAGGIELINEWLSHHDILEVVRHSDIDPKRKVDPSSGFPWDDLLNQTINKKKADTND